MNIFTFGLVIAACITSFALGISVMIIASLRHERQMEEAELEYMLNLNNEEAR
jgi:hypothetical protein